MSSNHYDAIVIGTGQGGVPLAKAFAAAKKKVAIVEKAAVGGTCINVGCTPTKTLVQIAKVAQTVRRAKEYGIHTSEPKLDIHTARELKRDIVKDFSWSSQETLEKKPNLDLIFGTARFEDAETVVVEKRGGGTTTLTASQIFIDTGARPFVPPIPGLDSVPYLDNASIMELDKLPEHLLVLGAGAIGLEFGQMFSRFGSKVTILEMGQTFMPHEDRDVADGVFSILTDEGVDIRLGAKVQEVHSTKNQIGLTLEGGKNLTGDQLLVAVGRTPNTEDLNLKSAGVNTDARGFVEVNSHLKTSSPNIYAIGDVKGGPAFTHISYDDYRILEANLLRGENRTIEGRLVPNVMFIDPELGRVGLNDFEAKQAGKNFRVCKMSMTHVARALEMNESKGFIKAIVEEKTDLILGVAVLGVEGGEVMSMVQLAMQGGLTARDLNQTIFAHPTLAEMLNNLFK